MIDIEEYIKLSKEERQKHLVLSEACHIRGTFSTQCRGLLAYFLDTSVPSGHGIVLAHACHNGDCSNPKHLYWGTQKENMQDLVEHVGYDQFCQNMRNSKKGKTNQNIGIEPWKYNEVARAGWSKAGLIFDDINPPTWDFSKSGNGATYLSKNYDISGSTAKAISKKLRGGWNPWKDEVWLRDFK